MTLRREIKDLENMKVADNLLADETYTLEDLLDPKTKYYMLKLTDEERAEFIKQKKIEVRCRNLIPCVVLGKAKLSGMNTYQYAERKGLTKDMTDEQKQMLDEISHNVSLWRILAVAQKSLYLIIGVMAICNFIINSEFQELYDKIQPEENYIFFSLVAVVVLNHYKIKKIYKDVSHKIHKIAKLQQEK